MELTPFLGIGNVIFGQTRNAIAQRVGAPETKTVNGNEEAWAYKLLRLELFFNEKHDLRLEKIISYHPYTLVLGFNPIGLKDTYLMHKFPNLVEGDGGSLDEPSLGLTFVFLRSMVTHVVMRPQIGVLKGTFVWPDD